MPLKTAETASKSLKLEGIQDALKRHGIPAWLFYDFRGQDPLALHVLALSPKGHRTRRWFYFVPAQGAPVKLVHRIEPEALDELPGEKILYSGRTELEEMLGKVVRSVDQVAMQYSRQGAVPYVSRVDAGTVELVRSFGVDVVSSGDLIQILEAAWSGKQLRSHQQAAAFLLRIVREAFHRIGASLKKKESITELSIQEFLLDCFKKERYLSNHPPIVAANAHSANPHYSPTKKTNAPIGPGSLVLLDVWCKKNEKDAAYADITWVAHVGNQVPPKIAEIFDLVREARDKAIDFVRGRILAGHPLFGYEVDDKARHIIASKGYGEYFTHRTGHSIGHEVHWVGANIDNFETAEHRRILHRTCFSIEPGIYLKEFGVRSEVDVYVEEHHVEVNPTEIQEEVVLIKTGGTKGLS